MYWKQFDPKNLPNEEVLAKNNRNDVLVGWMGQSGNCDDGNTVLENVTHYIPVANLLKLHNELKQ